LPEPRNGGAKSTHDRRRAERFSLCRKILARVTGGNIDQRG
jgi:hypothetical protein